MDIEQFMLWSYVIVMGLQQVFDLRKHMLLNLIQVIHAQIQTQINEETLQVYTHNTHKLKKTKLIVPLFPKKIMMDLIWDIPQLAHQCIWFKIAAKCDFPFLNLNIPFEKRHQMDFLTAIKCNDFDRIRAFILIFSPQKLRISFCNIEDITIQTKLFEIGNIVENKRCIIDGGYTLVLPLFLLPILGANEDTTKKVLGLLMKLQDLPYLLFKVLELSERSIFERVIGNLSGFDGTRIGQVIKNHVPETLPLFMSICQKNDKQFDDLYVLDQQVPGSLIEY